MFRHPSARCCSEDLVVEKIISPVLFDMSRSFKWKNTLSLTKELFIEVS